MKLSLSARPESLLVPLSVFVTCLLVGATVVALWATYDEIDRKAAGNAADVLHLAEGQLAREFDLWRFGAELAASVAQPVGRAAEVERRHMLAFIARDLQAIGSLFIIDADGRVTEDPLTVLPVASVRVERGYLAALRDGDEHLLVSEPMMWGSSEAILIGRRRVDEDGHFAGAALIAVPVIQLQQLLAKVGTILDARGGVALLGLAGQIIVQRSDYTFGPLRRAFDGPSGAVLQRILTEGQGSLVTQIALPADDANSRRLFADDTRRILTYSRVRGTDWTLVVSQSVRSLYAGWWNSLLILSAGVALAGSAAIILAANLRTELRRRKQAEITMAELATTDGLTGLANRRRFDEVIQRERDRALRSKQPLALLTLDVDRFKRINDSYGHATGDEVLRLLGQCILGQLRRPGDVAARTGGEEFAVVLPDTELEGAFHVAEHIRAEFVRRTASLFDGRDACTVSVGLNLLDHERRTSVTELLLGADAALYKAKSLGRDRIVQALKRPSQHHDGTTEPGSGGPDPFWPEGLADCPA